MQVNNSCRSLAGAASVSYHLRKMSWDWDSVWSVLRWVLLTLAVGFVGQFGRSLALRFIERRRKKTQQENGSVPPEIQIEQAKLDSLAKIEKKRAKAQVKQEKKMAKDGSDDS